MHRKNITPNFENLEDRLACSVAPHHLAIHHATAHFQANHHQPVQHPAQHHPATQHPAPHHPALSHPAPHRAAPRWQATYIPYVPPTYCSANPNFPWGLHLNDRIGDCVTAAEINVLESQLQTLGIWCNFPDSTALAQYERVDHYVPGNPATDNGETVISAELDWVRNGYTDPSGYLHRAVAWGPVNFRNYNLLARSVYLYGGVTMTCALPADAINQFMAGQTWTVTAGPGGAPWSGGGHEICVNGYNYTGPLAVTWGREIQLTWAWMSKYCTEAYATVTNDECLPNGHSPNGPTLSQLVADLRTVI